MTGEKTLISILQAQVRCTQYVKNNMQADFNFKYRFHAADIYRILFIA